MTTLQIFKVQIRTVTRPYRMETEIGSNRSEFRGNFVRLFVRNRPVRIVRNFVRILQDKRTISTISN